MVTLDSALQEIMQLDFNSREMLLEILQKRQSEAWRDETVKQAAKDLKEYRAGKLKSYTAEDLIKKLDLL